MQKIALIVWIGFDVSHPSTIRSRWCLTSVIGWTPCIRNGTTVAVPCWIHGMNVTCCVFRCSELVTPHVVSVALGSSVYSYLYILGWSWVYVGLFCGSFQKVFDADVTAWVGLKDIRAELGPWAVGWPHMHRTQRAMVMAM